MLSIGAMKGGQASYYLRLAQQDYYLAGGEPPGQWLGSGAARIGLRGQVTENGLLNAFQGLRADGSKLVQNAGKDDRQPGWDLTFSAPKSVSVLWCQGSETERVATQDAHAAAVQSTLAYIEQHFSHSRLGKGGSELVKAGLVVAAFDHSCSRALDPQLHTHCLVMNLGVDQEGSVRSILSKPFYRAKMLAGAYYRCQLAHELQSRIGVNLERPLSPQGRPQSWFEVADVPKELLAHFSKRRAAIEKELGDRGLESAAAAAFAALSTRDAKEMIPPRSELQASCKRQAEEIGIVFPALQKQAATLSLEKQRDVIHSALCEAVKVITESDNTFTAEQLTRLTLEAAQPHGIAAAFVIDEVCEQLKRHESLVSLGVRNGQEVWTTDEVLSMEREFLEAARSLKERSFRPVANKAVEKILSQPRPASGVSGETFTLDAEQQAAVRYIAQGTESIKVVTGFAGTGKTDMLAAVREALALAGYKVIGTALAGVAARTLQEKTGIESETVRRREFQLEPSLSTKLKHHARQLLRAAQGRNTWRLQPLTIDSKTVLVIDEAGMIGTRDFSLLAKAVVEQGGSIVAVGDQWQLPSIERGGCLAQLVQEVQGVHISEIRRQQDSGDRKAVKDLVAGDAAAVLRHYASKGQLVVTGDRPQLEERLIGKWVANGGVKNPGDHRIFVSTRADVDRYNKLAQWERIRAGAVDATLRVEHEGNQFCVGDHVRFTLSNASLRIRKGEGGTVIACKDSFLGKYVAVALHGRGSTFSERTAAALKHHAAQLINAALGKRTTRLPPRADVLLIPLKSLNPKRQAYRGLELDYCMTTHLGQGQTVKNSYIQLGGAMTDRELAYVQGSRHKEGLYLYCDEREAGAEITELSRRFDAAGEEPRTPLSQIPDYSTLVTQMNLSRAKELATSIQERLTFQQSESQHV